MTDLHDSKPNGNIGHIQEYFTKWLEGLECLLEERDKRYAARFSAQEAAVSAAFQAQKELNRIVAEASDRAIQKAEAAQAAYNARSNEFRDALNDQAKMTSTTMLSRIEYNNAHGSLASKLDDMQGRFDEKIEDLKKEVSLLREAKSTNEGRSSYQSEQRVETRWSTGVIISALFSSLAAIISVTMLILKLSGN